MPFVCQVVAPASLVLTNAWGGHNDLTKHPYTHKAVSLSASVDPAHVVTPGVDRVASFLKPRILGTYQGSVDPVYLQAYLQVQTQDLSQQGRGVPAAHRAGSRHGPVTEAGVAHG